MKTITPRTALFGPYSVDLRSGELRKYGTRVKMGEQPFQILLMLLARPGELVTREELRAKLWADDTFVDFDHGLNSAVQRLRDCLSDTAEKPLWIETIPRRGYRFIAPVESQASAPPGSNVSPAGTSSSGATTPGTRVASRVYGRRAKVLASALVVAIALLVGLSLSGVRERLFERRGTPRIQSLAVLPLVNLSSDTGQDYFADGMTEALTTDLGKIRALRVISRTSAMQYKSTKKPLRVIARELNVDALVEGTVARSGSHLRITANLVQASPEKHLWAESYESDLGDVLALEGELAQAIATAIQVKLTPEEHTRLASARSVDPEAYPAYLKGQYFFAKITPEDEQKALTYFQKAVEKDPNLVLAYVGISNVYQILGNMEVVLPNVAHPQGKLAIAKALQIDPYSGEAHAGLAWRLLYYDWDYAASEKEFKYALELNPNAAATHQGYAKYFAALGKFPESIVEMKRALDLDPLSLNKRTDLCTVLFYDRRYDDALAQCEAALEMDANYWEALSEAGTVYQTKGMDAEAQKLYSKPETVGGIDPALIASPDKTLEKLGLLGEWKTWPELQRKQIESSTMRPIDVAYVYSSLGRKDRAFVWLEKAYERRSFRMIFLAVDPRFDSLHSDPRFADLLRRIGLPP